MWGMMCSDEDVDLVSCVSSELWREARDVCYVCRDILFAVRGIEIKVCNDGAMVTKDFMNVDS
jgi:hypothetical protein